ncbi:MAG TPA: isoprenylcysteine carboxylmethyltransferase family protein [Oculatellaceae cyanobacterium]|nr:isoprenylcysteine carboxylmethyltransferase family protein [Anaerolineales bacterium]
MSRIAIFFLLLVSPALSLVLALLGLETLRQNLLGWVLLIIGIAYPTGVVIVYWFQKKAFWQGSGKTVKEEAEDRSFWAILPGMLVSFFIPPLEYLYFAWLPSIFWLQVVGLTFVVVGVVLNVWARLFIRSMYSGHLEVLSGHRLISSGPYHYVRHPSYAGFLLTALGIAVGYGSAIGMIAVPLLLLPGLAYRIRIEESLLQDHFGEEFRAYARQVRKLIPGIW